MPITARLVLPERFIRKNAGTPMAAAAPKQTSCRFVSPKNTLVFTLVKSRGTEIYAAIKTSFPGGKGRAAGIFAGNGSYPGQWAFKTLRARLPVLNRVKHRSTV